MLNNGQRQADIVIIAPTSGEWKQMLRHITDASSETIGPLPVKFGTIGSHSVVCCATGKGQEETASALTQLLERTHPRWVFLVGIAGGFPDQGVKRGDVAVAHTIHSFDYGKLKAGEFIRRPDMDFNCDRALLTWADVVVDDETRDWRSYILTAPPGAPLLGRAKAHNDCYVASSNKVVDDPDHLFYSIVRKAFPEIHAVEMEGSGAGASIRLEQSERAVGLLMIRGISDEPGVREAGGSDQRAAWKSHAAAVAAAFTRRLIEELPIGRQIEKTEPAPESKTPKSPLKTARADWRQRQPYEGSVSPKELPWPPHDVVLHVHVHPKRKNAVYLTVHFTRHVPGYHDTQGLPVEIPTRRAIITENIEVLLYKWQTFLANDMRPQFKYAVQAAGEDLLKGILGPFDGGNREIGERFDGLRRLLRDTSVRIRVLTKDVYIPWDLLYISDKGFVGELHCVETGVASRFSSIHDEHKRADLFDFGKLPFVFSHQVQRLGYDRHEELRSDLSRYRTTDVSFIERQDVESFRDSISRYAADQMIYFSFSHVFQSRLESRDGVRFQIGEHSFGANELRDWLSKTALPYRPLLFLNLYQGGFGPNQLRLIEQYREFHSEFFGAGLSGLIGPEVPVSLAYAVEFVSEFCEELFKGSPNSAAFRPTVGDCLWRTKRKLLAKGNLYGLLYSYYLVRDISFSETLVPFKQPRSSPSDSEDLSQGGL